MVPLANKVPLSYTDSLRVPILFFGSVMLTFKRVLIPGPSNLVPGAVRGSFGTP
jgi:hypothetical protein